MFMPFTLRVGQRLTDYGNIDVAVARVAHGGMGLVAMGPDRIHQHWFALKTMQPEAVAAHPDLRERFTREGLTWRGLWPHPNILQAHFVTTIDGRPFLVLNYAEQGSLADLLSQSHLTLASALLIAQHVAAGLVALHTPDPDRLRPDPIVHRDLTPGNVLIDTNNCFMITDFGLVALLPPVSGPPLVEEDVSFDATRSLHVQTQHGNVLGTMAYMAPEQWGDTTLAGPPVDVYALGLLLAHCITGAHPLLSLHQRHSVGQWRAAHERGLPQRLQALVPEVPVSVEHLYLSLLSKRAEDRPTAVETLAALNAVAQRLSLPPYTPSEVTAHTLENERIYWDGWAATYVPFALWTEALARNDRALQLAPHHPSVLLNRGIILTEMQRWEEALICYHASLQAQPPEDHVGRGVVYHQIGVLHNKQGQYEAADRAYAQALAEMPDAADTWHNRGLNEGQWGMAERDAVRRVEAIRHFRHSVDHFVQALRLAPNDLRVRQDLALSQHELQELGA